MIIGICGLIGSGKDTIAAHLVQAYGYSRYSWATPLKDIAAVLFGWDRDMLEGTTSELRAARELRDDWWSSRLDKEWSPRYALQYVGTEVMRNSLHPDIWVLAGQRRIRDMGDVVIPDTRFPNEIRALREMGGQIWRVSRGPDPEWFRELTFYKSFMAKHSLSAGDVTKFMSENYPAVHASEYSWHGQNFDAVFDNKGTVEDLITAVDLKIRNQARAA
jgi:hypothetical protein